MSVEPSLSLALPQSFLNMVLSKTCIAGKESLSINSHAVTTTSPAVVSPLQSPTGSIVPSITHHQSPVSVVETTPGAGSNGGTGGGVAGSAGVSSSQLYLLDSSYDLDLDSIDGSVSQPSHSESSQLGLIHSNAV